MHPLESPEYNFVNEELLKICFEKRDPIKPLRYFYFTMQIPTTNMAVAHSIASSI